MSRLLGPVLICFCLVVGACTSADPDAGPASEPADDGAENGSVVANNESASFEECPYTVTGHDIECGELIVPENHDEPEGAAVSLPYVVLPATGGDRSAEPMVYLQGGPGASTFDAIGEFAGFAELRRDRDMIFLEQRGTGVSDPFLGCDGEGADQLQQCYDDFVADGIDLSQYTTLNAAKDLTLLRGELGIDRWHLLGISYGTSLAMVVMDKDPEGTASVILDSPSAPSVVIMNADIESLLDVTSQLLAECSNDTECSSRYSGDLFAQHIANYEGLKDDPWAVDDESLVNLFVSANVDQETYLNVSFELTENDPGALPGFVAAVAERDEDALLAVGPLGWGTADEPQPEGGSVDQVLAECVADAECSSLHPDLLDNHRANLDGLKDEPWIVEHPNLMYLFFGDTVDNGLYSGVGNELARKQPEAVPGYVSAIAARDEDALLAVAPLGWGADPGNQQQREEEDAAIAEVLAECVADAECSILNPDLLETHLANLDSLEDEPWIVQDESLRTKLFGNDPVDHHIYRLASAQLAVDNPEALPGFVLAVAALDEDAVLALDVLDVVVEPQGDDESSDEGDDEGDSQLGEVQGLPQGRDEAFGYLLSVYCSEDQPFFDLETNPYDTEEEWPAEVFELLLPPLKEACDVWQVDPADPGDVDQIDSDIPTLILAGQVDPLTPLRQGEIAAVGLTESELLEIPSTGHGTIENDCARSIMADFLRAPGGDRSCLADIAPIEWK